MGVEEGAGQQHGQLRAVGRGPEHGDLRNWFYETYDLPLKAGEHTVVPENHQHEHGPDCGHAAVPHGDHVDYVHDGHRHARHGGTPVHEQLALALIENGSQRMNERVQVAVRGRKEAFVATVRSRTKSRRATSSS